MTSYIDAAVRDYVHATNDHERGRAMADLEYELFYDLCIPDGDLDRVADQFIESYRAEVAMRLMARKNGRPITYPRARKSA